MIMQIDIKTAAIAAALVAGAWVLYGLKKKAGAIVGAVDETIATGVKGIGSVFGIPDTNLSKCAADKAAGRTWDASFSCPAGDWLSYLVSDTPSSQSSVDADVAGRVADDLGIYTSWNNWWLSTQEPAPITKNSSGDMVMSGSVLGGSILSGGSFNAGR